VSWRQQVKFEFRKKSGQDFTKKASPPSDPKNVLQFQNVESESSSQESRLTAAKKSPRKAKQALPQVFETTSKSTPMNSAPPQFFRASLIQAIQSVN
jgi:hypothetical protein